METIFYSHPGEYARLLQRYHTVATMREECCRSRAWAYFMIASHPQPVLLRNIKTGKQERAVPRAHVSRYLARVKRGNPYW